MGNFRTVMSIGLLSLAACGDDGGTATIDAAKPIDAAVDAIPDSPPADAAPNYDFTCLNNAPPANVAATVTVSGTAQEVVIQGMAPAVVANVGVAIKACKGDCLNANNLGTTTSGAAGAYATAPLSTGGVALEGYLDATKNGDRRTLVYPPSPLAQNQSNVPVLQFSNGAMLALTALGITQDANKGMIGIVVTDCANMPIEGATVTVTPAGDAPLDLGALAQGMAPGTWLVTNAPAGDATIAATYGGMTLRSHVIKSVAGATTTTGIRPGY